MKQLLALERVCDKRHARALARGLPEHEAASRVVAYLDKWIAEHGKLDSRKRIFASELRAGYATDMRHLGGAR
jgi:hypothetical protein